jgi:hypothetical protein
MVALFWKFLRGIPFPSRTRRRSGSGLFFRKSALTTQRSHLCFRNVYWSAKGFKKATLAPKATIGRTAYSIVP